MKGRSGVKGRFLELIGVKGIHIEAGLELEGSNSIPNHSTPTFYAITPHFIVYYLFFAWDFVYNILRKNKCDKLAENHFFC